MKAYHIKQWDDLYERADTRKVDFMPWYPKQTKLIGIGIGATMGQEDNLELIGLWTLLETFASQSKKHTRGWLVRNGQPMTAEMMSNLLPRVPPARFQRALEHFSSAAVDWLEYLEWPGEAFLPGLCTGKLPGTSPDGPPATNQNDHSPGNAPGTSPGQMAQKAERREATGRNSATDRQTDRSQTDRQTDNKRERERSAVAGNGLSVSRDFMAALKMQWGACHTWNERLKKQKPSREQWTEEERREFQKNRATMKDIEKKQRTGVFA
jgi:hypothetical protein